MGTFFLLSQDASGCEGAENIRTLKLCVYTQTSVKRKKKKKHFKCEQSKSKDSEASSFTEGSSF